MKIRLSEIFGPTIQGEGPMSGVPCVFVRFSGCNMWDGRPETRADSQCPFCDTEFKSHSMMTCAQIAAKVNEAAYYKKSNRRVGWVWLSGGEPLLQLDRELVARFHDYDFKIAVETNGATVTRPNVNILDIDHVTVSPKVPRDRLQYFPIINTLKILYPHPNPLITPEAFDDVTADVRVIQPIHVEDNPIATNANIFAAVDKVLTLPGWRLSIQTHKLIGVE